MEDLPALFRDSGGKYGDTSALLYPTKRLGALEGGSTFLVALGASGEEARSPRSPPSAVGSGGQGVGTPSLCSEAV